MRAPHVAMVILASFFSAFLGGAAAGLVSGLARSGALFLMLVVPSILVVAHFAGKYMARRDDPPDRRELIVGSVVYILICIVIGGTSKGMVGIVTSIIAGAAVGFALVRAALTRVPAGLDR